MQVVHTYNASSTYIHTMQVVHTYNTYKVVHTYNASSTYIQCTTCLASSTYIQNFLSRSRQTLPVVVFDDYENFFKYKNFLTTKISWITVVFTHVHLFPSFQYSTRHPSVLSLQYLSWIHVFNLKVNNTCLDFPMKLVLHYFLLFLVSLFRNFTRERVSLKLHFT